MIRARLVPAVLAAFLAALLAAPQLAAAQASLRPHRAVYDLSLDERRPARAVEAARGRILFETGGNLCEGFATSFRQVVDMTVNGGNLVMDAQTSQFEEGDGSGLRFTSRSTENGSLRDETDGSARRADGAVRVEVRKPREQRLEIDGAAIFPTEHLRRLVEAARAGRTILEAKVYDGAEGGGKLFHATAIIGRRIAPGSGEVEAPARDPNLAGLARWPVTISYFEAGRESATPIYSIASELYENGVSRQLVIDYGLFVLRGTLTRIEWGPQSECNRR